MVVINEDVVEGQLTAVEGVPADPAQLRSHGEVRRPSRDQERDESVLSRQARQDHGAQAHVRACVGYERLGPGDHPAPVSLSGGGLDPPSVRAGVRFGQPERTEHVTLREWNEPAILLRVGAEHEEWQRPDRQMRLPGRRDRLIRLADLEQRGHQRASRDARPTVLGGYEETHEVERTHLAEDLGGKMLVLPPLRRVRRDLAGRELAREIAQAFFAERGSIPCMVTGRNISTSWSNGKPAGPTSWYIPAHDRSAINRPRPRPHRVPRPDAC